MEELIKRKFKMKKNGLILTDIGAGTGNTTLEVIKLLQQERLTGLIRKIILIDVDRDALLKAKEKLEEFGISPLILVEDMHKALADDGIKKSNIIISSASLHHTPEYDTLITQIIKILRRNTPAFFGLGEWTHGLWTSIELGVLFGEGALRIIRESSLPEKEENRFREDLMKLQKFKETDSFVSKLLSSEAELNALVKIARFWYEVISISKEKKVTSPIWLLEGHIPSMLLTNLILNHLNQSYHRDSLRMIRLRGTDSLNTVLVVSIDS